MSTSSFVHLRVHTAYSLLEGAVRIPELMALCAQHQMPAVGITDRDNLFGSMEFSQEAAGRGIQPIVGCQFSLQAMSESTGGRQSQPDQLLLYAKNDEGYENLLKLASLAYIEPAEGDGPLLTYAMVARYSAGLLALSGGPMGAVGRALCGGRKDEAVRMLRLLQETFPDRLYMEIMRHGLPEERACEAELLTLAMDMHVPLVATNDVYFHGGRDMFEAHDALMCIADGRYISEENRRKLTPEHRFKTPEEMRLLFADLPEAIDNTLLIAERCATMSEKRKPILPSFTVEEEGRVLSEEEGLRRRAREGLEHRLETLVYTEGMSEDEKAEIAKPYIDRLNFELDVIISMKFPGYFLIVSDFITWSKEQGIPVGPGRGSGAASVVAWSLLITDLDPLKYGLVFERFLNPERVSMPDFDIDFCQDRRDEVIRYVQQRYGRDRVAQIITFGKLQARAVLRDVGRVLQMPYGQVDRICKLVPNNPANPLTLEEAIKVEPLLRRYRDEDESVARLITIALKLEGLYRHASTHAAGVVIADRPLDALVPLYRDPRSDMPVVQYSMKYAEYAGLVKFDFLGLKTLTVLQKSLEHIAKRDVYLNLLKLPLDDKKTYQLLTRGDTVGVFQFESAGMRDSLRKLRPDRLEDLIALGALYRPGPMDNIPSYCNRKHGKEKPDYLHPMLEPVLKETYGVIIYQEQVQQIAQVLAGYTLGGADLLRRAMGKKIKEEMAAQRATFAEGAAKNGVDAKKAGEIFDLVDKFAGYGFNKAHAAAYALIGYQTAYLKANYPVEFIAASMTYDMHNTDKLAIFSEDAKKLGICVLPPDINSSEAVFGVEWKSKGGDKASPRRRGEVGGGCYSSRLPETLEHAKELRQNLTDAEQLLWSILRMKQLEDVKFRRQHPVGPYIVDFASIEAGLIIELDGGQHAEQQTYDEQRTAFLNEAGFNVLRFWNHEVLENIEGVAFAIIEALSAEGAFVTPAQTLPRKQGRAFSARPEEGELCIRYALGALKNVGEAAMESIVRERKAHGPFKDIFDFAKRVEPGVMNRRQIEQLVKAGAFDSLEPNRKRLFDSVDLLIGYCQAMAEEKNSNQISLFGESSVPQPLPALPNVPDWPPLERLDHEFGAVGFYLSTHPLEGYANVLRRMKVASFSSLSEKLSSQYTPIALAGIVTGMKIKASEKGRFAFVQLSDRSAAYEASIFDETVLDVSRPLLEAGTMVYLKCDAKMEESGPRVIITQVKPLDEMAALSSSERLEIVMDDTESLAKMQSLLGAPQERGCKVVVLAPIREARLAEIHIPGHYRISPEALLEMQTLNGIRNVAEL
jgi:DNA polymerase-3 subunit alpha